METSVPNEAKPAPERINPGKRARQLFGELFAAKNLKARAKAMQEFAALAPGEQTFIQCELLYLNLLSQERVVTGLQDLSEQLDEGTDAVIEAIEDVRPRDDNPLGLFDRAGEEAEEVEEDDVEGEELDGDDGEEDSNGEDDDEQDLDDDDSDNDDHTPEAA